MQRLLLVSILALLLLSSARTLRSQPSAPLRIATYNLLNYPGTNAAARNRHFRAIIASIRPDLLVTQEMQNRTAIDTFLHDVLDRTFPGRYAAAPFNDGPDSDNGLFYDTRSVRYLGGSYIATALRDIAEYRFMPVGSEDTIRLFAVHLKASEPEGQARLEEARILRRRIDSLPPGARFIVAGDFNIYRSGEPAFQELVNPASSGSVRCIDPLGAVGSWSNNASFAALHTQSPRLRQFEGGASGGMDDRFDMILLSPTMAGAFEPGSYTAYGNDGRHFDDSINHLPNLAVSDSIADALHYASDHLPVFADFLFPFAASVRRPDDAAMRLTIAPQPSAGSVSIRFHLETSCMVRVRLYDGAGRAIATIAEGRREMGLQEIAWDLSGLPSGVYLCEVACGSRVMRERIVHAR